MKKKYRVKQTREFEDIIKNGYYQKNKFYGIYFKKSKYDYDRYGISVSKKLGNSVFRNHYKRKMREIINNYKKNYINGKDYIIILRKAAINQPHDNLENEFNKMMNKINEGKSKNEEKKIFKNNNYPTNNLYNNRLYKDSNG